MATAERQARIVWEGPLQAGSGELEFVSSGIGSYPVTWASRVQRADGRTSPEELLAASHATCYAMALNATLGRDNPPQRLEVTATVSLDPKEGGGFQVTSSALDATGVVPGLDQAKFQEIAEPIRWLVWSAPPATPAIRTGTASRVSVMLGEVTRPPPRPPSSNGPAVAHAAAFPPTRPGRAGSMARRRSRC